MQPILDAPAVSRWGGREVVLATQNGKVTTSGCSVSLPRWLVLLACHVLHGRPTSKTFPHPEARPYLLDCQQSTTLARRTHRAAAAAEEQEGGQGTSDSRRPKPHRGREPRPPAFLLILTPHLPLCCPEAHCRSLARPRSCHGALFFSPVTRPGSKKVSLFSFIAAPPLDLRLNRQLDQSRALLLHYSQHDGCRFRAGLCTPSNRRQ